MTAEKTVQQRVLAEGRREGVRVGERKGEGEYLQLGLWTRPFHLTRPLLPPPPPQQQQQGEQPREVEADPIRSSSLPWRRMIPSVLAVLYAARAGRGVGVTVRPFASNSS